MGKFPKKFYKKINKEIRHLLKEAGESNKPYAAILYSVDKGKKLGRHQSTRIVVSAYNTEKTSGNSNNHAEINVLNMAAKVLTDEMFDIAGNYKPIAGREKDFYLFINTRPCPKCTAAIVDAQIFNVYFQLENNYKIGVSKKIIAAKDRDIANLESTFGKKKVKTAKKYYTFQEL